MPPTAGEIAQQIIQWVRESAPGDPGVGTGDRNERLLVAAYGRAYRCFVSIRQLAERGEADDAAILTRALLSIALRSLYLVSSDDAAERERRFRQAGREYFEGLLKMAREEAAAGVVSEDEVERLKETVQRMKDEGVQQLPKDYEIARDLELGHAYTRVYRPGSDVAHYSIGSALDGFLELTDEGLIGSVALDLPNEKRAEDVLIRAGLVYGIFLERSERLIGHGLTERVRELFVAYFREHQDEPA